MRITVQRLPIVGFQTSCGFGVASWWLTDANSVLLASLPASAAARSHTGYLRFVLERAEPELDELTTTAWVAKYGPLADEVRAALDWAFSPSGDASSGIA